MKRFLNLLRRGRLDRELDIEMRYHLESLEAEHRARGLSSDEARLAARRDFGGILQTGEACRDQRGTPKLESLTQDLRFAIRALRRNIGYTAVAILTLAVGIGANAAVFSFVDAVLLKPLPYPTAGRIVRLLEKRSNGGTGRISTPDYLDWKAGNTVFDQIATEQDGRVTLTFSGEPVSLRVARVSAQYFDVFGVKAFLGRTFVDGEDQPGKEHVVVLSHALWTSQFGADKTLLGNRILLDNAAYTVIGVLSPDTAFDRGAAQIWYPLAFGPDNMNREYRWLSVVFATLKPRVTLAQARSQMNSIAARIASEYPDSNRGWGVSVESYAASLVGSRLHTSLLALMAAVGGLLLVCCSNLANLTLIRGVSRLREMALRVCLGAGQMRLVQMLLIEHLVIAAGGALLGIGLSFVVIRRLITLVPRGSLPSEANVQLDARVLLFALLVSILAGILLGLAPAFRVAALSLAGTMKEGGRGDRPSSLGKRFRDGLVIAQVAIAFVLLCSAGLFLRSFLRLQTEDSGFDSTNILTMNLPIPGFPPGSNYSDPREFNAYIRSLEASVGTLPGVVATALTNGVPLTDCCLYSLMIQIEGHPSTGRANRDGGFFKVVTPSYFQAMGIRLKRGRYLSDQDRAGNRSVVVVNERLAERYFRDEDPIGKRILNPRILPGKTERGPDVIWEIVGVVADEKILGLNDESSVVAYASYEQSPVYFANLIVRAALDPATTERAIRQAISQVNNNQAVMDVRTMDRVKSNSIVMDRLQTLLSSVFSAIALLLAALGIYGVICYSVAQRTNELGIRAALGAPPSMLRRTVLQHGLGLTATGLLIGFIGASAVTQLFSSILYKTDARDAYTMAAVAAILMCVSSVACLVPARRATKIDPVAALRGE